MINQRHNARVKKTTVRVMASFVQTVARDSISGRCWMIMHNPEEPKNLAERVRSLKKPKRN